MGITADTLRRMSGPAAYESRIRRRTDETVVVAAMALLKALPSVPLHEPNLLGEYGGLELLWVMGSVCLRVYLMPADCDVPTHGTWFCGHGLMEKSNAGERMNFELSDTASAIKVVQQALAYARPWC